MMTMEFFQAVANWELADIAHPVVTCAALAALTPTPKPGTFLAKAYRVLDVVALNFLHAKSTGVTPASLAQEVAPLLMAQLTKSVDGSTGVQAVQPAVQPAKE